MKHYKFKIDYRLPGLNDFIKWAKIRHGKWNRYSQEKRTHTENIYHIIDYCGKPFGRVFINFTWVEPNKRRDPDNISSAGIKLILDAMVWAGIIIDDSQKYVEGWTNTFRVDKENPGVIVEVSEV